ncbi:MAG: helix-turn-helix transcriptional regulator [Sterolibacterium sp.]
MSPFSHFLKALRTRRGLRQKELAHHLGYEPSYLSALERSEKGPPRRDFIERLIKGLELNDEEIAELDRTLKESRRQLVLPVRASDEEYALARLLEPQLGRLMPMQIRLIELALRIPESVLARSDAEGIARHSFELSRREGRTM